MPIDLRNDVEIVRHEKWAIAYSPTTFAHLRLTLDEANELESHIPTSALAKELRESGFLTDSPAFVTNRITRNGIEFDGLQRVVARIPATKHLLFVAIVLAALSPVVLAIALANGHTLATSQLSPLPAALTFLALCVVATIVHELGHALVLTHFGRCVGRFGFGFYWGQLSFFVDASNALLLPKRQRILQAAAGVVSELAVSGALGLVALTLDPGTTSAVLLQFTVIALISAGLNLVPLLELDGYWVLSDIFDEPQLRAKALQALTSPSDAAKPLVLYGATSAVFGVLLLGGSLAGWWAVIGHVIRELLNGGAVDIAVAALLLLPTLAAIVGLVVQLVATFRSRNR